ncbi:cytidine deaminase [Aeromicrobium sp. CF4.19]|uniref:cytidine deaminase n=1 Tax=Aeromicrobium sp. CF4.19 TaxID=3373082 RepID=UPI003EE7FC3B
MELTAEDAKLVTLARASRARSGTGAGAAVRDLDGRTYAAASVALPSLQLDALDLAVAMAASSGAAGLEAGAVVLAEGDPDLSAVRDLGGTDVSVVLADPSGTVLAIRST